MPLPFSRDKGRLVAVALVYLGLPITPTEVTGREELTTIQSVKTGVNFRQWEFVFNSQTIQFPAIDTQTHGSILFAYHDDIRAPGRRSWLDYVMLQHMLHMLIYDRELRGRVAAQLFEMRTIVTRIDTVRNNVGATNVEFGRE